jgi:ribosomal protein S6--L-glutamate ligase
MRILVLSRNASLYSTSRLLLAARGRGHTVDVADPFDLQIVVARDRAAVSHAGTPLASYDAVVPRIGASVTRYALAVLGPLEESGVVVLNRAEAIQRARDKVHMLHLLAQGGLSVPRTVFMRSLTGVDAALALVGGCPVIVKLPHGTQGIGTMLAESRQALFSLLETLWAMGQEIVLQEYVREAGGRDLRAFVVGGRVVAAMRRTAQRGEFRANLHRGGVGEVARLTPRQRACAVRAAALAGLDVAGVDMLEGRGGPVLLEVNSSPGLEGIEQSTGVDVATSIVTHLEARVLAARAGRARSGRRPRAFAGGAARRARSARASRRSATA